MYLLNDIKDSAFVIGNEMQSSTLDPLFFNVSEFFHFSTQDFVE